MLKIKNAHLFAFTWFLLFAKEANALSLIEAYDAALEYDLTLKIAKAEYLAGKESKNTARAGLLPEISLVGGYQREDKDSEESFSAEPERDSISSSDAKLNSWSVSMRQALFDASQWFAYQRGKFESEQARLRLKSEQQSLIRRLVAAYVAVLRAQANLQLAELMEASDKNQLEDTQKLVNSNASATKKQTSRGGRSKTQSDVFQAKAVYDASVATRLGFEDSLGEEKDKLSLIIGRFHGDLWQLKEAFSPLQYDLGMAEHWIKLALENSPVVKIAEANRNVFHTDFKSAKAARLPSVYLQVSYNDRELRNSTTEVGVVSDSNFISDGASVSINASLPIFKGGSLQSQKRKAGYHYQAATGALNNTKLSLRQQITSLYRTLSISVKRIQITTLAVASSKQAMESLEEGYSSGVSDINDLLNARRTYFSTLRELNNLRYDYLTSYIELKYLVGTINPADLYELNSFLQDSTGVGTP